MWSYPAHLWYLMRMPNKRLTTNITNLQLYLHTHILIYKMTWHTCIHTCTLEEIPTYSHYALHNHLTGLQTHSYTYLHSHLDTYFHYIFAHLLTHLHICRPTHTYAKTLLTCICDLVIFTICSLVNSLLQCKSQNLAKDGWLKSRNKNIIKCIWSSNLCV